VNHFTVFVGLKVLQAREKQTRTEETDYYAPDGASRCGLVVSDLDIYRAANLLMDRHGEDALVEAAQMIDRMLDNGDEEGRLVWRRIKRAIEAIQAAPSGPVH